MTVEQIIQESVKDAKLEIEKARRMEIRRLLDYYTGTETDKYIDEYFSAMLLEKFHYTMQTLLEGL